jgi:hypothetical protein
LAPYPFAAKRPAFRLLLFQSSRRAGTCAGSGQQRDRSAAGSHRQDGRSAPQLSQMVALQDRLYRIAGPLLINNADLCRTQARNLLGFTAKNKYSYTGEFVDAAHAVLNYGDRLEVASVLPAAAPRAPACARAMRWSPPTARCCRSAPTRKRWPPAFSARWPAAASRWT